MNRVNRALPFLICAVVLAVCTTAACVQESTSVNETATVNQPDNRGATFEVGTLSVSPSILMANDTLKIAAVVKNTGDVAGAYTALLIVNEKEADQQQVMIAPTNSSAVTFQLDNLPAGDYEVGIGGSRTRITVYDWRPYTINYCKGQSDWSLFTGDPGIRHGNGEVGQIVNFSLPANPFMIKQIWINGEVTTENVQELDTRYFTVRIWSQDRSQQLWSADFPWQTFDSRMSWRAFDVPGIRVNEDFYVEVVTHSDQEDGVKNYLTVAFEVAKDALPEPRSLEYYRKSAFDSHSGWSVNGQPIKLPGREISLNWCIRVDGFGKF